MHSGGEILGRRTCCTCHARNRSSAQRGVLRIMQAISGQEISTFCTRPSIITLTARRRGPSTRASASPGQMPPQQDIDHVECACSLNTEFICAKQMIFTHTEHILVSFFLDEAAEILQLVHSFLKATVAVHNTID